MAVTILRIGHRPERDKRVTTHVALVARAFGAEGIYISSEDRSIESTVKDVVSRFGGPFDIDTGDGWRKVLNRWEGKIAHLTMYGIPLDEAVPQIPRDEPLLVVVGAEKVPREVYEKADYNISVGNQPHSEIAALALFMDRYHEGDALKKEFKDSQLKVIPCAKGKNVEDLRGKHPGHLPTTKECIGLLRKHGCPENVISHVTVVEKVAMAIAEKMPGVDMDLVSAGALLHDIGRSKTHGPDHAVEGVRIVEEEGVDTRIVDIIRVHLGAGLEEPDRIALGFPKGDYMPKTLEEKIIAHADNLVSDKGFGGSTHMAIRLESLGYPEAAQRVKALHKELSELAGVDLDELCKTILE